MKRSCCFLAVLLAAALLTGCQGFPLLDMLPEPIADFLDTDRYEERDSDDSEPDPDDSEPDSDVSDPDSSEEKAPAAEITEPPLTERILRQPIPDFLNEEQQQLFLHAYCAASEFLMNGAPFGLEYFPLADGSMPAGGGYEFVELDGWTYTVSQGRYRQWDDFQAMLDGLFTAEYQQELLGSPMDDGSTLPFFRPTEDGLLCFLDTGRGSDISYDGIETDTYELVSKSRNEICFDLIGHYTEWDYDPVLDQEVPGKSYTRNYPIRMVRTRQGWRVAEIHIPW